MKVTLEEIEKKYKIRDYHTLYEKVCSLIEQEVIKPVATSGKNGKKPALYNKYWVVESKEDDTPLVEELLYTYVPAISIDYYLKHIENYKEDRVWLLRLNEYLKNNRDKLKICKSINERSFEIWYREKFLKEEQGKKILKRCGISLELLNFYDTTEPLAYYSCTRETPQNMLILENKDTFYSMRQHLLSGGRDIVGIPIQTLIYGGGKAIHRSFQDFSLCAEPYMKETENQIYYLGDIDYEGILIFEKLVELFRDEYEIKPFLAGYEKMLIKADRLGLDNLPTMKAGQNRNIGTLFVDVFGEVQAEKIKTILQKGRYVPQEILSPEDF